MKKILIAFVLCMIAACSPSSNGEKYIGTWKKIKGEEEKLVIKRNNSDFLLTIYRRNPFADSVMEIKAVGTLKDGKLDFGAMGGIASLLESGNLLLPQSVEYSKESNSTEAPKIEIKPRVNPFQ